MISQERETFFESLLTAVKWKYTEEEQLIIFDKLPHHISSGVLLEKAVLKFSTKQPKGKELINFAWDLIKQHKVEIKKQVFEGCNNCIEGLIKVPNFKSYMGDTVISVPDNLINLIHATMYPSRDVYCNCTKTQPSIAQYLKSVADIQYHNAKLYEFIYICLYAYAKMWLSETRFAEFDKFNPYEVWGVNYEEGANLRRSDCENYGYLIDAEPTTSIKPKVKTMDMPKYEDTYKHKPYEGD